MIKRYYSETIPFASFSRRYTPDGKLYDYFLLFNKKSFDDLNKRKRLHPIYNPRNILRHELCHYLQFKKGWMEYCDNEKSLLCLVVLFLLELHAHLAALKREGIWKRIIWLPLILEISIRSVKYYRNQSHQSGDSKDMVPFKTVKYPSTTF